MTDISQRLHSMLRPSLLTAAARFALRRYDRARHLPRALGQAPSKNQAAIAHTLIDLEAELDAKRASKDASYSVQRHIDVLTALLAEASTLIAARSA